MLTASVMFGQGQHTIDFEIDGIGADWTWSYCCNGEEGSVVEIVDNPRFIEPNVSDKVGTFTCKPDGELWATFINKVDNGEFTFDAENCVIKMMIYKTISTSIAFKVEKDTTSVTLYQDNTVVDAWEEITFDFTANIGETYNTFYIMPTLVARAEDVIVYFDNIQIPKGVVDIDGDGTFDDTDLDDDTEDNPDETDDNL